MPLGPWERRSIALASGGDILIVFPQFIDSTCSGCKEIDQEKLERLRIAYLAIRETEHQSMQEICLEPLLTMVVMRPQYQGPDVHRLQSCTFVRTQVN